MKITYINQIRLLRFHIMGTLFMLFALFYLNFELTSVYVFLSFWVVYTLPLVYLHIRYYYKNKGLEIQITSNEIVVRKDKLEKTYPFTEIEKITLYKSASNSKAGIVLYPWKLYSIAKVTLISKTEIEITYLMSNDLEKELRRIPGVLHHSKNGLDFFWV